MNIRIIDPIIGAVIFGAIGGFALGKDAIIYSAITGAVCGLIFVLALEKYHVIDFERKNNLTQDEVNAIAALLTYSFTKGEALNLETLEKLRHDGKIEDYLTLSKGMIIILLQQYVIDIKCSIPHRHLKPSDLFRQIIQNPFALGYIFGAFENILMASSMKKKINNFDAADILIEGYKNVFDMLNGKGYILVLEETVKYSLDKTFLTGRVAGLDDFLRFTKGEGHPYGIIPSQKKLGL